MISYYYNLSVNLGLFYKNDLFNSCCDVFNTALHNIL